MTTQSINAATVNGDRDNKSIFSTPLSARGSTKLDAISIEDYDRERHLYPRLGSSQQTLVKSDFSNYVDLDEDDDLKILCFTPTSMGKGQSSSSSSTRRTFDCEICVERKPKIESFRINECSHSYCNDCVSKYIAARLQDNILSIKCPVSGCPGQLEPDQCRLILPGEVFDRWGDALCEAVITAGSTRFYCPYKDCSALVYMDEKIKESECPHCHRMVCVECGTKWHAEITCEEFQKLGENERERDDILLKKMAESKKWKRCPNCKFYVQKTRGCSTVICRCGLPFCYKCGAPLNQPHSCRRTRRR
ncbi:hypothetical protein CARUB_v10025393mg [Capsella rubella]|uniref:RBR-type E3 ubiquitin transferase n=1 Tax=Capsella rubella TaxID=81985 RepID=R0G1K3_9BRAS|nr:probable E3 ubiquitin-protein ligase RNF144A-B [Capsella rubella]EOA29126.1 hypothetical protein CARUB_v10025393mg [Capsella rubella]